MRSNQEGRSTRIYGKTRKSDSFTSCELFLGLLLVVWLTSSLDKPWQRPPPQFAQSIKDDGSTPAKTSSGRRALPDRLQQMIKQTPKQTSVRDYEGVHSWWWAAYDEALEDLRASGVDEADLQKVDEIVVRKEGESKATH